MELKKVFNIICFSLITTHYSFSKSNLKILATNQDPSKIRFLSHNGKFTYYQKRTGELMLSSNFNIKGVLKDKPGTQYIIYSSPFKKKLIIEKNNSFQLIQNLKKNKELFVINFGGNTPLYVGKGQSPQIHLKDQWISFFNSYKKIITFKNIHSSKLVFNIKISNKINPFFIPYKEILHKSSILYTDLNKKGFSGLIHYDLLEKKSSIIYKAKNQNKKIEICVNNNFVFVGVFPMDLKEKESIIFFQKIDNFSKENFKTLYESKTSDIGNIVCKFDKKNIFFVKNIKKDGRKDSFEIAKLRIKEKKLSIISDLDILTQIIVMDGKLLTIKDGEFYLLEGKNNLSSKEFLNQVKINP
jgi:hypothetical protein